MDSLIRINDTGERHIYNAGTHNNDQMPDFAGFLSTLSSSDILYRTGLGAVFTPFNGVDQLASSEDFSMMIKQVRDAQIFPFINCARDSRRTLTDYYVVVYKLRGRWMHLYLTPSQVTEIVEEMTNAYGRIMDTFICNVYTMLTYHGEISGYCDDLVSDTALQDFRNMLSSNRYEYVLFHTLSGSTINMNEEIVSVLCFDRKDVETCHSSVHTYYADPVTAEYMHDAVMGDMRSLQAHLGDGTGFLSDNDQSENRQDSLESSLDSSVIDRVINGALTQIAEYDTHDSASITGSVGELSENERPHTESDGHMEISEAVNKESFIPENSNTYLIDETTSRFSNAIWYKKIQETDVMVAGLGGIGSWVAFLLARMKPNSLKVIDPDAVEEVNMAGQLFGENEIGMSKTTAICGIMSRYCHYYNYFSYTDTYSVLLHGASDIMICGFDNMRARKLYFQAWHDYLKDKSDEEKKRCLFIDGRLNAEEFQILCIRGDHAYHQKKYRYEWLFTDYSAEEATCSYKQTSFCANMIASCIVNLFVNHIANQCDPVIERTLPFLTYYNAETMQFKID